MRVWIVCLVVLAAYAAAAANGAEDDRDAACGTCDSLGYMCVEPNTTLVDNCNQTLSPGECPVPSCNEYCLKLFGSPGGKCSDATHLCDCGAPVPVPAAGKQCKPVSCDVLARALVCIPNGTLDACTGLPMDPATRCPDELPPCNVRCGTPNGTSSCDPSGTRCLCANTTAATPTSTVANVSNWFQGGGWRPGRQRNTPSPSTSTAAQQQQQQSPSGRGRRDRIRSPLAATPVDANASATTTAQEIPSPSGRRRPGRQPAAPTTNSSNATSATPSARGRFRARTPSVAENATTTAVDANATSSSPSQQRQSRKSSATAAGSGGKVRLQTVTVPAPAVTELLADGEVAASSPVLWATIAVASLVTLTVLVMIAMAAMRANGSIKTGALPERKALQKPLMV